MGTQPFVGTDEIASEKQDVLSITQMNAVNSGITATNVSNLNSINNWRNELYYYNEIFYPELWENYSVDRVEIGKGTKSDIFSTELDANSIIIGKSNLREGKIKTIRLYLDFKSYKDYYDEQISIQVNKRVSEDTWEYVALSYNECCLNSSHDNYLYYWFDDLQITGEEDLAFTFLTRSSKDEPLNNYYDTTTATSDERISSALLCIDTDEASDTYMSTRDGNRLNAIPRVDIEYEREWQEGDPVIYRMHMWYGDQIMWNFGLPVPSTRQNADLIAKCGIMITATSDAHIIFEALQKPTDYVYVRLEKIPQFHLEKHAQHL